MPFTKKKKGENHERLVDLLSRRRHGIFAWWRRRDVSEQILVSSQGNPSGSGGKTTGPRCGSEGRTHH